jgi:hypothetical protein
VSLTTTRPMRVLIAATCLAVLSAMLLPLGGSAASASADGVQILSLSGRSDVVMGGDVLLEIVLPASAERDSAVAELNGGDVTDSFAVREAYDGRIIGLVDGLALGTNTLTVTLPDGSGAALTINNHPQAGPVTSGPQLQPWRCDDGELGDCARDASYELQYSDAATGQFRAYDASTNPAYIASTTTDEGVTVPFIVRIETGVLARDQYRIAVLFQPEMGWTSVEPQEQFNHKTVITHGASCDTNYQMGTAPDVMLKDALGRGFAVISHALDNAGHNCNIATQAEALFMTKELLADEYGAIRYAIGTGCSGGALAQQQVANAYPGVYQGILPACSFADAWSTAAQYVDYVLLRNFFEGGNASDPTFLAPDADFGTGMGAVYGHPNPANPISFTTAIPNSGEPTRSCVPDDEVYDENTNPDGVRCTLQDYMVNVFGRRAVDGFANRPYDNVGVQYGLAGLQKGTLSFGAFLNVNTGIGGFDIDLTPIAERSAADPAGLVNLYLSGASNTATNMDQVAIIDLRGPDDGAFHDAYRTTVLEQRLVREHGHSDNHVRWRGQVPLLGDANFTTQGIVAMDEWLAAVEADVRDVALAQKIVDNKTVLPRCTSGAGQDAPAGPAFDACVSAVREYSSPRIEAGMPITDDVAKCQLISVREFGYGEFVPTEAQLVALEQLYVGGVCDYTKSGVSEADTIPWMTYEDGEGRGRGLGAAPISTLLAGDAVLGAVIDRPTALAATGGGAAAVSVLLIGLAVLLGRRRRD